MTHRTLSQILTELTVLNIVFNRIVDECYSLPYHTRKSKSIETFKKNVLSFIKDNQNIYFYTLRITRIYFYTFKQFSYILIRGGIPCMVQFFFYSFH